MNDIQATLNQTPIEIALQIDESGHTTARALYEFLDMPATNFARWAKTNIENNEFYEENKDYWGFFMMKNGNNCKDYRLTTDFAKHLCMESHSSKGKIARQYFITIEDKAKQMVIDRSQLSPQLQSLYGLIETQARQEIEQKRQAEQLKRLEQKQDVISNAFVHNSEDEDFKAWVNRCISKIAESPNYTNGTSRTAKYQNARAESYERLNSKRSCRLTQRVAYARGEALKNGATKTQANDINKLTIIAMDKNLKPIYETVIKEMMICYCVKTA